MREALHEFAVAEVGRANKPFPDDEHHVFRHEDKIDTILSLLQLPTLFRRTAADFDRLQAAEEMMMETQRDSGRFWQFARGSLARWLKRDVNSIRLPENIQGLEGDFWQRVEDAIREANDEN